MFDGRKKFNVVIDGKFSVYTSAKQIRSGIGDDDLLNYAVQCALDRLETQKETTKTIIGVSGIWNDIAITIKLLQYGKN